jgi:hypothetical protein
MPRYVEPKSKLAFRNGKSSSKAYLLPQWAGHRVAFEEL